MTRPSVSPPRFGEKIMGFVLADDERYEKLGDFEEGFRARIQSRGPM